MLIICMIPGLMGLYALSCREVQQNKNCKCEEHYEETQIAMGKSGITSREGNEGWKRRIKKGFPKRLTSLTLRPEGKMRVSKREEKQGTGRGKAQCSTQLKHTKHARVGKEAGK